MTFIPNREELAWAAGFFDGEGCVCCDHYANRAYIRLSLAQAEQGDKILQRFNQAIGGIGKVHGPFKASNGTNAPSPKLQWALRLNGLEKVQAAIAMLWPFLSEPKREQYKSNLTESLSHRDKRFREERLPSQ